MRHELDIIAADDDLVVRKALELYLAKADCRVRAYESGTAALEALKAGKPDLLLLDIMMPGLDGYEVCSALRADPDLKDLPVIFISALTDEVDKARAFALGALDYVTKPFDPASLWFKISSAMEKKARWSAPGRAQAAVPPERTFSGFKRAIIDRLARKADGADPARVNAAFNLKKLADAIGITLPAALREAANYLGLGYCEIIAPEELELGIFPPSFMEKNHVAVVRRGDELTVLVSDPFDLELADAVRARLPEGYGTALCEPRAIDTLYAPERTGASFSSLPAGTAGLPVNQNTGTRYLAARILELAANEDAAVTLEAGGRITLTPLSPDSPQRTLLEHGGKSASGAGAFLRALAGPDGAFDAEINGALFSFGLTAGAAAEGETLTVRQQ